MSNAGGTEPNTSKKKVARRRAVIVLGILCIILSAGLVAAFAYYVPMMNDRDNAIAAKDAQISSLNQQLTSKINLILGLSSQLSSLISTLNLENITVWVDKQIVNQTAGSYYVWTPAFPAFYAGYVTVEVTSSTNNTYVRLIYSSHGVNYDDEVSVGASGTAAFPVLPGNIEIRVGNTDLVNGANETVTITYYY